MFAQYYYNHFTSSSRIDYLKDKIHLPPLSHHCDKRISEEFHRKLFSMIRTPKREIQTPRIIWEQAEYQHSSTSIPTKGYTPAKAEPPYYKPNQSSTIPVLKKQVICKKDNRLASPILYCSTEDSDSSTCHEIMDTKSVSSPILTKKTLSECPADIK